MRLLRCSLFLLAGLLATLPAASQTGMPDTGLRRQSPEGGAGADPGGSGATAPVRPLVAAELPRALSETQAVAFAAALQAIDDGRYADARARAQSVDNPLVSRYVAWSILRSAPRSDADFEATWRFLRENPEWPEPETLRRQAEERIAPPASPTEVFRYFTAFPPLTSNGHMRRLEAAETASPNDLRRLAGESWRNATFRTSDENEFLNRYGQLLSPHDHIARFDRILREGRTNVAADLLSKLPPDYQPVAEARLAMATRAADAARLLKALPAARLDEPQVRLERLRWLRRSGNLDQAKALLLASPASRSETWWNERQLLARELLTANRAADAYAVVVPHGLTRGVAFAEAEFLAGSIALRQLRRSAEAQKHFKILYDGVSTDISRSRAAYWLARAYEAARRRNDAKEWFGRAAQYGRTFYGQMAARKVPGEPIHLPDEPPSSPADQASFDARELGLVARYLGQAADFERTRPFLLRLARQITTPGETVLLARLAMELKRPDVALTVARRGVEKGVMLFDAAFPVVDLGQTGSIERALALAVTRQESAFNAAAVSPSGALGLMQLLPATAREVAGKLNVPFLEDRLTRDPAYNVQLGTHYLAEMLRRFDGSYELALAAYNAGPNRVSRWLDSIGDPRSSKLDMVDWIEAIPFRETRNYVQRIMEALAVYRERLNGSFRTVPPAVGRS